MFGDYVKSAHQISYWYIGKTTVYLPVTDNGYLCLYLIYLLEQCDACFLFVLYAVGLNDGGRGYKYVNLGLTFLFVGLSINFDFV